jgi:hypothetical protein
MKFVTTGEDMDPSAPQVFSQIMMLLIAPRFKHSIAPR